MKILFLLFAIFLAFCGLSQCHLLIVDRTMDRMLQFTANSPFCYLHTDRDYIQVTLLNTEQKRVKVSSDEEIEKLVAICKRKQLKSSYQGGFIYPGTKWCGPGTVAENYTDLGNHKREDRCCREHDHCPNFLARGDCKRGICNKSLYTRSHCDCDAVFRRCLQNVNSETANTIGAIFFNIVQVICFKQRSPCSQLQSFELSNTVMEEGENAVNDNTNSSCPVQFVLGDRYVPSEVIYRYSTKGELLESYINRLFKKLYFL